MFGTYRYLLALMVVVSHLLPGQDRNPGGCAVFGFYMLSGYLMTYVLVNNYGFTAGGLARFSVNRALRIYPPYLVVMAMALIMVLFNPTTSLTVNKCLLLPCSISEWIKNIFIFGLTNETKAKLVPPAWSLYLELVFYIAMAIVLSRKKSIVVLWFCMSVAYTAYMVIEGYAWGSRYLDFQAVSLPFSTGAMIYYFRGYFKRLPKWHTFLAGGMFLLNAFYPVLFWKEIRVEGFYSSVFLSAYLVVCLVNLDGRDVPAWATRIDRFLGNLSYPIFLCHYPVVAYVVEGIYSGAKPDRLTLFMASLPFINLTAYAVYHFVDQKVNMVREGVRAGGINPSFKTSVHYDSSSAAESSIIV